MEKDLLKLLRYFEMKDREYRHDFREAKTTEAADYFKAKVESYADALVRLELILSTHKVQ